MSGGRKRHPLAKFEAVALIAVGGFAGAEIRYLVSLYTSSLVGTLGVNVTGCFVLGFILYEEILIGVISREARFVLATGFTSSLTTYSTFALQTAESPLSIAILNVGANYSLGFLGVLIGRQIALELQKRVEVETPKKHENDKGVENGGGSES